MTVANTIALLFVVVLLPIAPAFLLYKYMPSKTIAEGPFKGLDIHLTGAFAGYFLTLLVVVGVAGIWTGSEDIAELEEKVAERNEQIEQLKGKLERQVSLWTIRGQIQKQGQASGSIPDDIDRANVLIEPPSPDIEPLDGSFEIEDVPISEKYLQEGATILKITHQGYEPVLVYLKKEITKRDTLGPASALVREVDIRSNVKTSAKVAMISSPIKLEEAKSKYEGGEVVPELVEHRLRAPLESMDHQLQEVPESISSPYDDAQ